MNRKEKADLIVSNCDAELTRLKYIFIALFGCSLLLLVLFVWRMVG